MFNYDYVKIHFNMPIKILQTFSGSYHFIKIKQNKTINVYFQEPSSICDSEFKAHRLPYTGRPQHLLGFLTARFSQVCTRCILDIKNTSGNLHASSVLVLLRIETELGRFMMTLNEKTRTQDHWRMHIEKRSLSHE